VREELGRDGERVARHHLEELADLDLVPFVARLLLEHVARLVDLGRVEVPAAGVVDGLEQGDGVVVVEG